MKQSLCPPFALLLLLFTWSVAAAATDHAYPSVTAWPIATHRADADGSTTNLLFGILHHRERGSYERHALRPYLFDLETDADRDWRDLLLLFNLARFEREGEDFRRHLFPLYWHGRRGEERWFHLWPLYGDSARSDGSRTRSTLYPLFSLTTGPGEESWSADYLWPLGASSRQPDAASDRFLPFWWRHRAPERDDGLLFPYLWFERGETVTRAVLPLWWWQRSPQGSAGFLFPYAWRAEEQQRHDLLVPLWWRQRAPDRRFNLVVPLYFDWRNPESEGSVVLPVWYSSRSTDRRFTTFVPFYLDWRSPDDTRLKLVLPVYLDHRGAESSTRVVVPVYFRRSNAAFGSTLRYWFPVFGRYERGPRTESYWLFPLYAHMQDPERGYDSHFALWPLIHRETLPEASDTWVLPLFRHKRAPDESDTMALLLWWSGTAPQRSYSLLAPFYWHFEGETVETHLFPLYSDIRKSDGYRKRFYLGPLAIRTDDPAAERHQTDILWPLISHQERGDREHTRILPFWWSDRHPGWRLSLGSLALLPPYYLHRETPDRTLFHLWPFYGKSEEAEFREDALLWPLFRYGRSPDGEKGRWQALLAYGGSTPDSGHFGLFPLWHHGRKQERSRDLSLLHWYERAPESTTFSLLHLGQPGWSLFQKARDQQQRHSHLFPLYSLTTSTDPDARRLWLIWPLYRYEREGERTDQALLWKILYRSRAPERSESGFLWRFIRARSDRDSSLFEFNPFFYREQQADGSERYTAWLGGIYAIHTTPERSEHRLFWFLNW